MLGDAIYRARVWWKYAHSPGVDYYLWNQRDTFADTVETEAQWWPTNALLWAAVLLFISQAAA